MNRWQTKALCAAIMFVAMLVCFLSPIPLSSYFERRPDSGKSPLDHLACFAGGVFLACYLIFMAAPARQMLYDSLMVEYHLHYPVPDLLIGLGFFLMLTINRIVISLSKKRSRKSPSSDTNNNTSTTDPESAIVVQSFTKRTISISIDSESKPAADTASDISEASSAPDDLVFKPESSSPYPLARRNSIDHMVQQESVARSIVMMFALSCDSILEGMTTGLKMSIVEIWAIFIGNLVHESVIAFCLGLQLMKVHQKIKPVAIAAFIYSLMNPIGVVVGTLLVELQRGETNMDLFNGIFQAITSGVFIYVTFCEILEGQLSHRMAYSKILCIFAGFVVMSAFAVIPGHTTYKFYDLYHCDENETTTTAAVMSAFS